MGSKADYKRIAGVALSEKITINTDKGDVFIFPCWPVSIPKFEEFDFVVHKSIEPESLWRCSERSTGFSICAGDDSDDALANAAAALRKKSVDDVRIAIDKAKAIIEERNTAKSEAK